MLDIHFIREHSERVKSGMLAKGETQTQIVDSVLEVDENWRELVQEIEELRHESNTKSEKIGQLMGEGKKEEAQKIIDDTKQLKKDIKDGEKDLAVLKQKRDELLLQIPNMPHESVPEGQNENDNEVFKTWPAARSFSEVGGEPEENDEFLPHWELTEKNDWIDFERGAKVTGAGFPFYKGTVAKLQRGLINYFLDKAVEKGFTELQTPFFVNEDSARGTGQIPDKEDMMYEIPRDSFSPSPLPKCRSPISIVMKF